MIVLVVLGFLSLSFSTSQAQSTVENMAAPWLEIKAAGVFESKPGHRGPLQYPFANHISGKRSRANKPECSTFELDRETTEAKTPSDRAQIIQGFFSRCESFLRRFDSKKFLGLINFDANKYFALLKMAEGNYPLKGRPHLREIILHLPYKTTVHGLLALKDLEKARPMVVVICGSACNLSHSMARLLLLQTFDSTPFNVLVLPSLSGTDFIKDNKGFGLGGFEEGRQTFEVIRLIGGNDSPFRKLISSFHVIGVSLGGNAALFTSTYGTFSNPLLPNAKIQSVIGICPVVDLKKSLMDLDRNDIVGKHFTNLIMSAAVSNFAYVFGSNHDMPTLYSPGHNQSVEFLEKMIYPRYKILSQVHEFQLAPFSQYDLDTPESFWKANNFLNYYHKVNIPTFALYSKDDFIVSPRDNGEALENALKVSPNPFVNVIHLEKGSHCAASQVYGDDIFVGALKNIILAMSPEFDFSSQRRSLNLKDFSKVQGGALRAGEKYFGYEWSAKKKSERAFLNIKIWSPDNSRGQGYRCSTYSPYYAYDACLRSAEMSFPLKMFFPQLVKPVASKAQAQVLTRWLNGRAQLLTKTGREPVDTEEPPSSLVWNLD